MINLFRHCELRLGVIADALQIFDRCETQIDAESRLLFIPVTMVCTVMSVIPYEYFSRGVAQTSHLGKPRKGKCDIYAKPALSLPPNHSKLASI